MAISRVAPPDEAGRDEHLRFFRGLGITLIVSACFWGGVVYGISLLLR